MNIFKISIHVLVILSLGSSINGMENGKDQLLKKVVIGTYVSTILAEIALIASPAFQSFIFGNETVNEATKNHIQLLANSYNISSVPTIQQGYSLWHKIVGSIFSNHATLFVNPSANILTSDAKDDIKKSLIAIEFNRDRNILIAALAVPIFVYGTLTAGSLFLKNIVPTENGILSKIKIGIDYLSQNFKLTALITLGTIYGFIKAQDYYLARR